MVYLGLFTSCFLAATLLPGGSEALLIYVMAHNPNDIVALVAVASIGNALGSVSSYGLGYVGRLKSEPTRLNQRAVRLFERYGVYSLLLSWLPLIGDVLCIIAGYFKLPIVLSTTLILLAKTMRYVVVAWVYCSFS